MQRMNMNSDADMMEKSEESSRSGTPLDPWWVRTILRRHWATLGMASLVGLGVGVGLATVQMQPTWESTALIVPEIADERAEQLRGAALHSGKQLLEHPTLLATVREQLHSGPLEPRVEARTDLETGTIELLTRAGNEEDANALSNAVIAEFLARSSAAASDLIQARLAARQTELTAAQESLNSARETYDAFRMQHGIVNLDSDRESAIESAAEMRAEADRERVAAESAASRVETLRTQVEQTPRTRSAPGGSAVDRQLAQARAELAQAESRYTEQHPIVMNLREQVRELRARARNSTGSSVANPLHERLTENMAEAEVEQASRAERAEQLSALAGQAEERLREISNIDGEAAQLLAAVRIGEQTVRNLQSDIAVLNDQAANPAAPYRVTTPPFAPEPEVNIKKGLALAAIPPIAFFVVAFVFWLLRDRGFRARTALEVAWWSRLPVVGVTTWPRDDKALDLIIGELEDVGTYATGRTLVVPATEAERPLVSAFVGRLARAPWCAAGAVEIDDDNTEILSDASMEIRTLEPRRVDIRARSQGRVRRASVRFMLESVTEQSHSEPASARTRGHEDVDFEQRKTVDIEPVRADEVTSTEAATAKDLDATKPQLATPQTAEPAYDGPGVVVTNQTVTVGDEPARAPQPPREATVLTTMRAEREMSHALRRVDDFGRPSLAHGESRRRDAVVAMVMSILDESDDFGTHTRSGRHSLHHPRTSQRDDIAESAIALAWEGSLEGPSLRRATRLSDRVLILAGEGSMDASSIAGLTTRFGRKDAVGILMVAASDEQMLRPDRVGPVADFWTARRHAAAL